MALRHNEQRNEPEAKEAVVQHDEASNLGADLRDEAFASRDRIGDEVRSLGMRARVFVYVNDGTKIRRQSFADDYIDGIGSHCLATDLPQRPPEERDDQDEKFEGQPDSAVATLFRLIGLELVA